MFKNILIVGCGLIGSSILRASINKKTSKNFFVYEKSKKNIREIKKINKKTIILKKLDNKISDILNEYSKLYSMLSIEGTSKKIATSIIS